MKMPFGKHKGKDLSELQDGYLEWLVEESYIYTKNRRLYMAAYDELKARKDEPEISEAELSCKRMDKYTLHVLCENRKLVENIVESWYHE